jgi:hypothetical protein
MAMASTRFFSMVSEPGIPKSELGHSNVLFRLQRTETIWTDSCDEPCRLVDAIITHHYCENNNGK